MATTNMSAHHVILPAPSRGKFFVIENQNAAPLTVEGKGYITTIQDGCAVNVIANGRKWRTATAEEITKQSQ